MKAAKEAMSCSTQAHLPLSCVQVRHETYVAEFTSHLSEEERQKQAEAEFKVCTDSL